MAIEEIPGSSISEVSGNKDRITVVDFSAEWCGPCKMLHPVLEELSESLADKVTFYTVDVDNSQEEANSFGIRGVPTMIVFHEGNEIDRMVGFRDASALSQQLQGLIDEYLD